MSTTRRMGHQMTGQNLHIVNSLVLVSWFRPNNIFLSVNAKTILKSTRLLVPPPHFELHNIQLSTYIDYFEH